MRRKSFSLLHKSGPMAGSGACPICGSWPTLAEQRGLDRARLRCGRCGGDWSQPGIRCLSCAGDEGALADRATIDLDLVALEREYERPEPKPLSPPAVLGSA